MKTIIVLHEYGAPAHYIGLEKLASDNGYNVKYYEFTILRHLIKSLIRKDYKLFKKTIFNILFIIKSLFTGLRHSRVVLGIAPYDYRVIFIKCLVRNSKYFLHTSWPQWFGGTTPKKEFVLFKETWNDFILNASGIFAVTEAVKSNILSGFNCLSEDSIKTVYHAVSNEFSESKHKFISAQPNRKLKALFVGRYDSGKGLHHIFKLAKLNPDVEFVFVGFGSVSIPSADNIFNFGRLKNKSEIARLMSISDFLLLPSVPTKHWQEAFGLVVIESLSHGVYPIVSDNVGPRELVEMTCGKVLDIEDFITQTDNIFKIFNNKTIEERNAIKLSCIESSCNFYAKDISNRWKSVLK